MKKEFSKLFTPLFKIRVDAEEDSAYFNESFPDMNAKVRFILVDEEILETDEIIKINKLCTKKENQRLCSGKRREEKNIKSK
jgi:hypothetical protein